MSVSIGVMRTDGPKYEMPLVPVQLRIVVDCFSYFTFGTVIFMLGLRVLSKTSNPSN